MSIDFEVAAIVVTVVVKTSALMARMARTRILWKVLTCSCRRGNPNAS